MIDSLEIRGFRCFDHLEVKELARVNLLVGANNRGKTSLLEALELWGTRAAPSALEALLARRDEHPATVQRSELSVRHLFHGRELEPGRAFEIAAFSNGILPVRVRARIVADSSIDPDSHDDGRPSIPVGAELTGSELREGPLELVFVGSQNFGGYRIRLSADGNLPLQTLRRIWQKKDVLPLVSVPTRSLSWGAVASMFSEIVLTDEEPRILNALKTIDSSIERLAHTTVAAGDPPGSGLYLRCKDQPQRIPIGSMGDGIWRFLTLALALVKARGGMLLIDEIDTGLHFSVMFEMWKLVIETAQRLDVQVFATTHSRDCYESLAAVLRDAEVTPGTAAVHRIDRERNRTVVYDERRIIIAAEDDIEVR
jgi:AAA domain, putative AbiEii toxin, Type IV TA system/AAA ATPase domain